MTGDEGREISYQQVPTIGGVDGAPTTAKVVASKWLGDGERAEGVMYTENPGTMLDTGPFPTGTAMTDSTPSDDVN